MVSNIWDVSRKRDNYVSSQAALLDNLKKTVLNCARPQLTDGSINSESPSSLKQSRRTMLCLFAVSQLMKWPRESGHSPLADARHSGKEMVTIVVLQRETMRGSTKTR